ncbi:HAMP domain-containing sensor histidine kinase [Nesterenkonia halophila]|uniref:sensor histidine kinase n=1 Tax=Nesterenkonia halophila TaxID=302044 RepID=UPI0012916973|nr:HAMP domain-containing sensor histidine kinase [Nesterenkonia halophila]
MERLADSSADPASGRRRRLLGPLLDRLLSVRARILAAVVGLAALALAAAGTTAFVIQQVQVEQRIDAELEADAEQFRVLHEVGIDPSTGEDFSSPTDLVRTAMQRIIPTRHEDVVGMVDGQVAFTSPVTPMDMEHDAELVEALSGPTTAERASLSTITTEQTTYRVAVVPVHPEGDEEGGVAAFAMAHDIAAEKGVFAEGFVTYGIVAALSLVVVAVVGSVIAGRLLRPVGVLASSARRIGREDLSERIPVTGSDDLAEMTRSVNEMLDRLEDSVRAQDRLIHDVSHELRTPLTILRGHLEVLDVGDPEDVTATRRLTLDEMQRMNRVIDDLTTLAQAGHPEFVHPVPADVGRLTDEVYDKAVALGEQRWVVDARAEGEVSLDRERITQAWLQLAANAAKFSPPGAEVRLGSELVGGELRLTVRDQGAGIAEEDRERIFERFGRADASTPGSGLGLPIVREISRAHRGRVEVDSELGVGTIVTVVLPTEAPRRPEPGAARSRAEGATDDGHDHHDREADR